MPYIFKEQLDENETQADVIERDIADAIANERDNAKQELEDVKSELENLKSQHSQTETELFNLRVKFTEAFLSAGEPKKQEPQHTEPPKVSSFDELFSERN